MFDPLLQKLPRHRAISKAGDEANTDWQQLKRVQMG